MILVYENVLLEFFRLNFNFRWNLSSVFLAVQAWWLLFSKLPLCFISWLIFTLIFSVPSLPPAPSSVPTTHPLLIRNAEPATVMGVTRVHRGNRQRGTYRFNPSTSTLQVNIHSANNRQPNPPVILQRWINVYFQFKNCIFFF